MKKSDLSSSLPKIKALPYLIFAVTCVILMFAIDGRHPKILTSTGLIDSGYLSASNVTILDIIYVLIAACAIAILVLAVRKKLTDNRLFMLLITIGFLMRLAYTIYNIYSRRQHDVQDINHTDGHAGYILWILNNGFRLPQANPIETYQFYQPPLLHYISAVILKILTSLGQDLEQAFEALQMFPLFLSSCTMLICLRFFKEIGLKGLALRIPAALVILHPTFFFFSGYLNNDPLMTTFVLAALLFTVRWYKNPVFKRILPIALCVGLGMMAKLSAVLVAPAIALVFLVKFWQLRKEKLKSIVGQFAGFAAVSVPLGLWWGIRNFIRFKTPISWVPLAGGATEQWLGNYTAAQRLFDFQTRFPFITIPYFNDFAGLGEPLEHGIFSSLLKTSLFGEWTLGGATAPITVLSHALFWVNNILALFAVFAMVAVIIKSIKAKSSDLPLKLMLAVLYMTLMISQIQFCLAYPHVCTQNFRYIVPALIAGCAFIGYWLAGRDKDRKAGRIIRCAATVVTALFCVLSVVIYVMLYTGIFVA